MKQAFGLSIPESLEELCSPERAALIIYDMQVGIVPQISTGQQIASGCRQLLAGARNAGLRVFFTRHLFLPNRLAGVGHLRRAMVWQRKSDPAQTRPLFTAGSPSWQIVPELAPQEDEAVIDKIAMSAFEGTYLTTAMRDAQLSVFLIAGIALEIGIEPTVRHALDLNFIPVLVSDLCGSKNEEIHDRSLETLRETGEVVIATAAEVLQALGAHTS